LRYKNDIGNSCLTGREFHVAVVGGREEGGLELNAKETKY